MIILSLDPSSSCTGYAVLERVESSRSLQMIEAGKLRGKAGTAATGRVLAMRDDLLEMLNEVVPHLILVEMPTEKQYTRTQGKRSGMAVWAGAAWAMWMVAVDWAERFNRSEIGLDDPIQVHSVSNTAWTKGTSKQDRKIAVKASYPYYNPEADAGGDVADAVALGLWWYAQSQMAALKRAVGR